MRARLLFALALLPACAESAAPPPVASRPCDPLAVTGAETHLEYAATTPDGHRLFVFYSTFSPGSSKANVFYGAAGPLLERRVLDLNADSSWHLTFDLDGVATLAQISGPNSYQGWGPSRLQPATESAFYDGRPNVEHNSIPLTPIAGSRADWDTYNLPIVVVDGGTVRPPLRPQKPDAEIVAGLSFLCF